MSDNPPPPAVTAAEEPPRPRRRSVAIGVVVAIAVASVAVPAAILLGRNDKYPKRWDPRVKDLVDFVEQERGLRFEHPVKVEFLADAAFRRAVTAHDALTPEDRAQLESLEAVLRAVGLLDGDADLERVAEQLVGEGVVGFYDPTEERLVARGTRLDDERRVTLVHELTHALQDQHFGIERETKTSGEDAALQSLVEADAVDVENAWIDTLPAAAAQRLEQARQRSGAGADFTGVPDVFVELISFPYVFGPDFLHAVLDERGRSARDELFRRPPTTEEQIVRPETYLEREPVRRPPTPKLRAGERIVADSADDVGMLSLLVVLSERIDFVTAWHALQSWAGDAMVAFRRGDTVCLRAAVNFEDEDGARLFATAFDEWAGEGAASARRTGATVGFEACDPGTSAPATPAAHVSGIQGLEIRKGFSDVLIQTGAPRDVALCVADAVIERVTIARMAELGPILDADPNDPRGEELQAAIEASAPGCR
jgi:hypothetical protein